MFSVTTHKQVTRGRAIAVFTFFLSGMLGVAALFEQDRLAEEDELQEITGTFAGFRDEAAADAGGKRAFEIALANTRLPFKAHGDAQRAADALQQAQAKAGARRTEVTLQYAREPHHADHASEHFDVYAVSLGDQVLLSYEQTIDDVQLWIRLQMLLAVLIAAFGVTLFVMMERASQKLPANAD